MAQTIQIKRSSSTATPTSLSAGELAYSDSSDKLFIGQPSNNTVVPIGGKHYTDMLDNLGAGTGLTFSGNIFSANVDGTNSEAPQNSTTSTGRTYKVQVDSSDNLVVNVPWSGGSLSTTLGVGNTTGGSNIVFGDSSGTTDDRLVFGAGSDLQMYHHITAGSFLREVGTGDLFIQSDGAGIRMRIEDSGSNLLQIHATATETKLGYAGNTKLTTKTGGVEVTGSVVATGLDINGNADISGTTTLGNDVTFTGANGNIVFDKSDDSLEFADDVKASFGASGDLKIFHDGTSNPNASMIEESGTGNLIIKGSNLEVRSSTDELYAQFVQDGVSKLYCDNAQKLSTKSDGVLITGELQSTTLDVNGNADISGSLTVSGDLNITGNVNSTSVTDLDVTDKTITVGVGQSSAQAGASGLEVDRTDGTNPKFLYNGTQFEIDDGDGNLHGVIHEGNSATQTYTIDGGTF